MPVFFKNLEVGQVSYKYLELNNKSVEVVIFVEKQFVSFIHTDSKFWMKNTMNVDFSKGNIDVDIAPINFLLRGGLVFSSSGENKNSVIPKNYIFTLYKSQTEAESKTIGALMKENREFMLHTKETISHLTDGSVVRFDGFDIGKGNRN